MRYYTKAKRDKAHENAVRRGKLSGIARAKKRMERGDVRQEPARRELGEWIGELQFRDSSGKVRRWPIFQARRKNQIIVADKPMGWDRLFRGLRKHVSTFTR